MQKPTNQICPQEKQLTQLREEIARDQDKQKLEAQRLRAELEQQRTHNATLASLAEKHTQHTAELQAALTQQEAHHSARLHELADQLTRAHQQLDTQRDQGKQLTETISELTEKADQRVAQELAEKSLLQASLAQEKETSATLSNELHRIKCKLAELSAVSASTISAPTAPQPSTTRSFVSNSTALNHSTDSSSTKLKKKNSAMSDTLLKANRAPLQPKTQPKPSRKQDSVPPPDQMFELNLQAEDRDMPTSQSTTQPKASTKPSRSREALKSKQPQKVRRESGGAIVI